MAATVHKLEFFPNPMQKGFIMSQARADLFSSRRGEGKSTALAWACFHHTRMNPGASWMLLRDTWENMQKTTMDTFFHWFPPGIFGTFHQTKKTFTWAEGVARGVVEFTGMDDPRDASKLLSRELAGIGMDEPAPAVGSVGIDETIFDLGLSSLRQPGMNWRRMALAENNPDESHWTYRRFVTNKEPDFVLWQPSRPENEQNLPPGYYADLRRLWAHRPDIVRRFVEGEFGFQQEGKAVTPQWSDKLHLATGLHPLRSEVYVLWDWGHNPTAIFTQISPMGYWLILDALVGEDIGVEELVEGSVVPLLRERYRNLTLRHIGDPQGKQREQTSIHRSAVKFVLRRLGGTWRPGPVKFETGKDALQAVLARTIQGRGMVQVDRERASAVWWALRGGWHYHVARTGLVSAEPKKDIHSHPGDAMRYGAARLFPLGKLGRTGAEGLVTPREAGYWGERQRGPLEFERPGLVVPKHGATLGSYLKGR